MRDSGKKGEGKLGLGSLRESLIWPVRRLHACVHERAHAYSRPLCQFTPMPPPSALGNDCSCWLG